MIKRLLLAVPVLLAMALQARAQQPDPNFFIYLCFGQSNMEAGARPAEQDKDFNDPRFQFMAAVDMPRFQRERGHWYTAVPPICRETNNMGPVDFFGRKMIEVLPEQYKVGVINVSVAGAKLELWDKDACDDYLAMEAADPSRSWLIGMAKEYGMNPYQRLLETAREAQKYGVIKGMLLHQGESNPDDPAWPGRVKKIHDDLCAELGLDPTTIPLLAGELKYAEQDGVCAAFNEVVLPHLPEVMPNAYVISALGCESTGDQFHFSTEGMRLMGYRMADKMLELQGFKQPEKRTLSLQPDKLGIEISPTLSGIFFEDINQSVDGGICAQLIQNNSFQAYNVPDAPGDNEFSQSDTVFFGWTLIRNAGAVGAARTVADKPLVKKLKRWYDFDPKDKYDDELRYKQYSVRFDIQQPGAGFGIAANGYGIAEYKRGRGLIYSNNTQVASIPAKEGVSYELGLYLQGKKYKGRINVWLEDAAGNPNSNVITISGLGKDWKKYTGTLKAERSVDSRLAIVADAKGTFWLDFVTLVPEASELWKEGKYGPFRKDLLEALEALHPTFMRFPGGCASEGTNYFGQVFWKNSIGPREERLGFRNHWGYWTSQYIGFYEYLLMAEGLGATPLPVLNNGVTCQFAGHQYIAPLDTQADRDRFYSIFVKDALDFIEFCNGGTDTRWGAMRAQMGHPAPFNLKYLGIGNENQGPEFWERFDIMYKAIKAQYPDITIVSTAGAADAGREFNNNMAEIDAKYPDTIVDEHYYKGDDWFYGNRDRYAPGKVRGAEGHSYDRSKPTRVFVGEFANNRANNAYSSAMAEAAYWTSLERNSDMVVMAAYAPLFCKKGFNKWDSNLIWFDNRGMWRSCNYWYQQLFSVAGDRAFAMSEVMNGEVADGKVYTSPTIDTKTGEIFIKLVNAEAVDKLLTVDTGSGKTYTATLEFVSSHDTSVKNQGSQNYYSSHPDYATPPTVGRPAAGERPGLVGMAFRFGRRVKYSEAVVPHTKALGTVWNSFTFTMPENSIGILRLKPQPQARPAMPRQTGPSDWGNFKRYEKANAELTKAPLVVLMGDSITDFWYDNDPDFFTKNNFAGRGISGQTASQMLVRFKQDVVNLHPKAVAIMAGTNDLCQNMMGQAYYPDQTILDNIKAMCELAEAAGIKVLLCSITPCAHYMAIPEQDAGSRIVEINKQLKAYADSRRNITYVDYHTPLADAELGLPASGTYDGIHPAVNLYDDMERILTAGIKKALNVKTNFYTLPADEAEVRKAKDDEQRRASGQPMTFEDMVEMVKRMFNR